MRNLLLTCCLVLLAVSPSLAKENIASHWLCAKPTDQHSVNVGDQAGHAYAVASGTCNPSGTNTLHEKTGTFWNLINTIGNTSKVQGTFVSTTLSGDKINYATSGTYNVKNGLIQSGMVTWSLAGGTGKFATISGHGTCTALGNGNGTTTFTCGGSYNTP
jgi:hypothetical protein